MIRIFTFTFTYILLLVVIQLNAAIPDKAFIDSAETYYSKGDFAKAADLYQKVADSGFESAELYYNLGNAYFKLNHISDAILYYEKAQLLAPNDEDIKFNLELSRSYLTDKINKVPEFFLNQWVNALRNMFNTNQWAMISVISFFVFLALLLFFVFSSGLLFRKLFFYSGIIIFFISLFSFVFAEYHKSKITNSGQAIVYNPVVTVKSSPDSLGIDLFILHDGTKVNIMQEKNDWIKVRIDDGKEGWIHKDDIKNI